MSALVSVAVKSPADGKTRDVISLSNINKRTALVSLSTKSKKLEEVQEPLYRLQSGHHKPYRLEKPVWLSPKRFTGFEPRKQLVLNRLLFAVECKRKE